MLLKLRNRAPKILIHPDKRLKRIAEPVDFEATTYEDRVKIVRQMNTALGGVHYGMRLGLAAPQIGINKRVIIVRGNVMFNPEWTPTRAPLNQIQEACYSCPGKIYKVGRAQYGWAKWTDINGRQMSDKLKELPAVVFQHELDHLDGKCCADVGEEIEAPRRTPPEYTNPKP